MITQKTNYLLSNHPVIYFILSMKLILITISILACQAPASQVLNESNIKKDEQLPSTDNYGLELKYAPQIGQYIVEVFEDSRGILWFGTLSKGVAKYDRRSLTYMTIADGLPGNAVVSITEDKRGNLWFGTQSGLSIYDGESFVNYTTSENLCDNRVSKLMIDQQEVLWIGTWGGVCMMDLNKQQAGISTFELPTPEILVPSYQQTAEWVTDIIEDKQGNIWISRSGYGVCRYNRSDDSESPKDEFTLFSKEEGLLSNCVQVLQEDADGMIWLGCRVAERDHPDEDQRIGPGGLCRYDPNQREDRADKFEKFPNVLGLVDSEVYSIYNDKSKNVWIGAHGTGLYRYDGQSYKLFSETNRPDLVSNVSGVQSILQDKQGRIWLGLSGGLFRYIDGKIINVSTDGPWR